MKHKLLLAIVLIGLTAITSCKKEEGPAGPAGPAGPTGPAGNSNVQSYSFSVPAGSWVPIGTPGNPGYGFKAILSVPAITADIMSKGTVDVEIVANGYNVPLPVTLTYNGYQSIFEYGYTTGLVSVEMYDTDLATVSPTGTFYFRVIVTAGTQRIGNTSSYIRKKLKQ